MYIVCQGIFSDSIPKRDPLISIKCVAAERQNYITDQIVGVQRRQNMAKQFKYFNWYFSHGISSVCDIFEQRKHCKYC